MRNRKPTHALDRTINGKHKETKKVGKNGTHGKEERRERDGGEKKKKK